MPKTRDFNDLNTLQRASHFPDQLTLTDALMVNHRGAFTNQVICLGVLSHAVSGKSILL